MSRYVKYMSETQAGSGTPDNSTENLDGQGTVASPTPTVDEGKEGPKDANELQSKLEAAEALVKSLRSEAADRRVKGKTLSKENQELADRLAQLEAAQTAAVERAKAAELSKTLQKLATDNKVVDVETLSVLVEKAGLEYDEDGNATNVESRVKEILESKPFLKQLAADAGKASNPARDSEQMLTADMIATMSVDELSKIDPALIDEAMKS